MKLTLLSVLGLAATAVYADEVDVSEAEVDLATLYTGPIGFPPGIAAPPPKFFPHDGPPKGSKKPVPVWHPSHKGVVIDECDDDHNDKWHWAFPKKGGKPHGPPHKWTTSTVTATKTKTVIDCDDGVDECPGHPKTQYTTTTVEVTTTVCPVPVTEEPHPGPKPTYEAPPAPPAEETGEAAPVPEAPAPTPAPPADVSEAPNASAVPSAPAEAAAPKAAAGLLAVVAAFIALF